VENDSVEFILSKLYAAELEARRLHDALAARGAEGPGRDEVVAAAVAGIGQAKELEGEAATARLVCLARLLGEFEGADVADALIDVLDSEQPEVRNEAGEQLQGLAYDRFKEVALAVERALGRLGAGNNALVELPFVLAEIPEGGVTKLLEKFLEHSDPDAVASAVEALVEIGDPAAAKALAPLLGDERRTRARDDEVDETEVSLGDLAAEAIELLGQPDGDE
jgi:HEAT repeat protein